MDFVDAAQLQAVAATRLLAAAVATRLLAVVVACNCPPFLPQRTLLFRPQDKTAIRTCLLYLALTKITNGCAYSIAVFSFIIRT